MSRKQYHAVFMDSLSLKYQYANTRQKSGPLSVITRCRAKGFLIGESLCWGTEIKKGVQIFL